MLVFSMLGLGRILISDLVVANLLMYSLVGMILLYLAASFFTPKVFLDEIIIYWCLKATLVSLLCIKWTSGLLRRSLAINCQVASYRLSFNFLTDAKVMAMASQLTHQKIKLFTKSQLTLIKVLSRHCANILLCCSTKSFLILNLSQNCLFVKLRNS